MSELADSPRPTVGLMLSCGEPPEEGRNYPKRLDYIRPKEGQVGQWAEAAHKFTEVYGERPRMVDISFVGDTVSENLDVRPMVWGSAGLKARGTENLAAYPPRLFGDKIRSFDWDLITFPDDSPEPGRYRVDGREDAVVQKLGLKVFGSLYCSIPSVLGLMMVAAITTTSARTIQNWYDALTRMHRLTGGILVGIPCQLILRPARGRYWDAKEKKRKQADFQEWCIDTYQSARELYELAAERRQAIGMAPTLVLPPKRRKRELPKREMEIVEATELGSLPDIEQMIESGEFGLTEVPDEVVDETLAADG